MFLVCGEALYDFFLDDEDASGAMRFDARVGGSPFNVAIGISRLGGKCGLLTGISTDMLGERLVGVLEAESVSTRYLLRSDRLTTVSLVGLDTHGSPAYAFYGLGSADRNVSPSQLPSLDSAIAGIHFGSYSLVVKPVADAFMTLAGDCGGRFVSVDPNVRPTVEPDLDIWRERVAGYASHADLIKVSAEDLESLYPGESFERRAREWMDAGVKLVIVTDGGDAVQAWTSEGANVSVAPPKSSVVDTVGAGDTFQAALLTRLAETGDPKQVVAALEPGELERVLNFAATAAAITCSRRGADMPRRNELKYRSQGD